MKIHTSLNYGQMYDALRNSGAPIGFESLEQVGSRTHANGYHVRLSGTGGRGNTGLYGAGDYDGATWDEWGAFFGALFEADPEARCGGTVANPTYANASHYHYLTGDRFQAREPKLTPEGRTWNHLPADTHPRHRWEYDGPVHYGSTTRCSKCSAFRPPFISGQEWS